MEKQLKIKIISGGQTGADRAALDWAIQHGMPHGGWCPHGRRAEDGRIPEGYMLQETPGDDPAQRTEWNVRDSDGTVVLSIEPLLTGGSQTTVELAHRLRKPVLHLCQSTQASLPEQALRQFIHDHRIAVLNVAGPRASDEPALARFVHEVLEKTFGSDRTASVLMNPAFRFQPGEASSAPLGFVRHDLGDGHLFWTGLLPAELVPNARDFEVLWAMHPPEYHEIKMHGRLVRTPRWQQAYGEDYHYTGRVNKALPVPAELAPLLAWGRESIDHRLNGMLMNWYDGKLGHYIGRHRDSRVNMITGTPIVTISIGEERVFRLRPWPARREGQCVEFPAFNGSVFVMPFETNLAFTHEVPAFKKWVGHRISVTCRSFSASW